MSDVLIRAQRKASDLGGGQLLQLLEVAEWYEGRLIAQSRPDLPKSLLKVGREVCASAWNSPVSSGEGKEVPHSRASATDRAVRHRKLKTS